MLSKYILKKFIEPYKVDGIHMAKIAKRQEFNSKLGLYYWRIGKTDIAERVEDCHKSYFYDGYDKLEIRDIKSTNLCRSMFCLNCQKVIQANRLIRFTPILDDLLNDNKYIYHFVFTVPNCNASDLSNVITNIFKCFSYINRYFNGAKKISGINFSEYGYIGSIRSLEVTYNDNEYHPHIHCIFAFNNELPLNKYVINKYSYSYGEFKRYFSDFEVLLQKIWFLLINGFTVNMSNIESLDVGYSVTVDLCSHDYYEAFKYAFKVDTSNLTFNNFDTLYNALYKRRLIQGYGVLYKVSDNVDNDIDNSTLQSFNEIKKYLNEYESPKCSTVKIWDMRNDLIKNEIDYISGSILVDGIKDFDKYEEQLFFNDKCVDLPKMKQSSIFDKFNANKI